MAAKKKSKKTKKAKIAKAKKAPARKTKARKIAKPAKSKKKTAKAKKIVKAKKPATRTKRASRLEGEGSYTAARNYDKAQEEFVAGNRGKIGKMAHDAETALEGPEGSELREAEREGRSKARA